jgi:hypothetical protein
MPRARGGARCDHTQRGRSRELLQARHARLGPDNFRKGQLGFGEHDEQAGRPDSVVSHTAQGQLGHAGGVTVLSADQVERHQRHRGVGMIATAP